MDIALWTVQALLALIFLYEGVRKAFQYEKAKASLPWVKDCSRGLVAFVGWAELLGSLGLILPWALNIAPVLTPIAAFALTVVMVLAAAFHARRKEYREIMIHLQLISLLLFVGIGRL